MNLPAGETHMCFGCSPHNPIGFKLKFSMLGDICRAEFIAGDKYQGWNGCMHGGLIATLLDETMAQWLWLNGIPAMTAEMTTRYSLAVPINTPLILESSMLEEKGKLYILEGKLILPDKKIAAKSKGKFLRIKPGINVPENIF